MAELYNRWSNPFVYTPDASVGIQQIGPGKILDLRIHWTAANIITSPPYILAAGETKLLSVTPAGTTFTLKFGGKHPLTGKYYDLSATLDTSDIVRYRTYGTGIYKVVDSRGNSLAYLVRADSTGRTVLMEVNSENLTLLLDVSKDYWAYSLGDSGVDSATVEPFNVIFDPPPPSEIMPKFVDISGTSAPVSGGFTNTPIFSSGAVVTRLPIAHAFELTGNALALTGLPTPDNPPDKVISINGLQAEYGNINIKALE